MRFDVIGDVLPVLGGHIRGVHQRLIFMNGEIRHFLAVEFWHQRQLALQVPGNGNVTVFRSLHTDSTAGIGNVDGFLLHGMVSHQQYRAGKRSVTRLKKRWTARRSSTREVMNYRTSPQVRQKA
ncbi:hypothetical protein D3C75_859530 [compost metagenome]